MATFEMTEESRPYFDALVRLVVLLHRDAAAEALLGAGIQELMELRAIGRDLLSSFAFPRTEEDVDYCPFCQAELAQRPDKVWDIPHEEACAFARLIAWNKLRVLPSPAATRVDRGREQEADADRPGGNGEGAGSSEGA